jgi:hypothetical protein
LLSHCSIRKLIQKRIHFRKIVLSVFFWGVRSEAISGYISTRRKVFKTALFKIQAFSWNSQEGEKWN